MTYKQQKFRELKMNKNRKRHINKLVKRLMGKGIRYLIKFKYKKVVQKMSKIIELNPNYHEAYFCRGIAIEATDYEQAINDYTKAIELKPDFIKAYLNRGMLYGHELSNMEKAIMDCSTIIKYNSDCYGAYRVRGKTYRDMQEYDKAIQDFSVALKTNNIYRKIRTYMQIGKTYCITKNYNRAISTYTRALEILIKEDKSKKDLDFLITHCYELRSKAYLEVGEKEKADNDLKLAAKIDK